MNRQSTTQRAARLTLVAALLVLAGVAISIQSNTPLFSAILTHAQGLDPRCSDRTARGKITCRIDKPDVKRHETVYSNVVFTPGDIVEVKADGCVQTGGWGATWKRYVNPSGDNSDHLYHGLIRIPTGTKNSALVRIKDLVGRPPLHVTGVGVPLSELVLHLGYEDD